MKTFTIGQLSKASNVKVETIRYYEQRGLILKAPRRESGYRQFSEEDVKRLRFIKHAQLIGFTLNEISELLSLKVTPEATCGDINRRIDIKLTDIHGKVSSLLEMERTLLKLKKACKQRGISSKDCPVIELLDAEDPE